MQNFTEVKITVNMKRYSISKLETQMQNQQLTGAARTFCVWLDTNQYQQDMADVIKGGEGREGEMRGGEVRGGEVRGGKMRGGEVRGGEGRRGTCEETLLKITAKL